MDAERLNGPQPPKKYLGRISAPVAAGVTKRRKIREPNPTRSNKRGTRDVGAIISSDR